MKGLRTLDSLIPAGKFCFLRYLQKTGLCVSVKLSFVLTMLDHEPVCRVVPLEHAIH